MCGPVVAVIWAIVLYIIGLTHAHGTDAWRAILAVLLPIFLCLCCIVVAFMTVLGAVFGAMAGAGGG
jgi:hypothetical protein